MAVYTRPLTMPPAAWAEAERRAAAANTSVGEAIAAALLSARFDYPVGSAPRRQAPMAPRLQGGARWAHLPDGVAAQVFGRLADSATRRAARAVSRSWAAQVGAHTSRLGLREWGAPSEARCGRWQALCPGAEALEVALHVPELAACSAAAAVPGLQALKCFSVSWHLCSDAGAQPAALAALSGLEELELRGAPDRALEGYFAANVMRRDRAALLKHASELRRLRLEEFVLSGYELGTLAAATCLEELTLVRVAGLGDGSGFGLGHLGRLTALRCLKLSSVARFRLDNLPPALSQLTNLEHLVLNGIDNGAMDSDEELPLITDAMSLALSRLQELVSFECTCDSEYFDSGHGLLGLAVTDTMLAALARLPKLQRVVIVGDEALSDNGLASLGQLTSLTELRVDVMNGYTTLIADPFMMALRPLTALRTLCLDLFDPSWAKPSCSSKAITLSFRALRSLESLTLSYHAGPYSSMADLTSGWWQDTRLPVMDLSFMQSTTRLEELNVTGSVRIQHLRELRHARGLRTVVLPGMWDTRVESARLRTHDLWPLVGLTCLRTLEISFDSSKLMWGEDEAVEAAWAAVRARLKLPLLTGEDNQEDM